MNVMHRNRAGTWLAYGGIVALSIFIMHLLGDVPSPPLIGILSDMSSLARAFLIVPLAILISGIIWSYAAWRGGCETS